MTRKFTYTISDLGSFLGKSPITLRQWEHHALISFPRDSNGDRKMNLAQIREAAKVARQLGRISETRLKLVEATVTMLELIEKENVK